MKVVDIMIKYNISGKYIYFGKSSSNGVNRKIQDQIDFFRIFFKIDEVKVTPKKRNLFERILSLIPFVNAGQNYDIIIPEVIKSNFLYIRKTTFDSSFYKFLKTIRKSNPKCLIIIEIPTYPYFFDTYAHNFIHFIRNAHLYLKDLLYRRKVSKLLNYYSIFCLDDYLFSVPTIKVNNGANINKIKTRIPSSNFINGEINVIAVAHMGPHSGFERIILGLYNYMKSSPKYNYQINIIGDGDELAHYKFLVKKYQLELNIKFHGRLSENEINKFYNTADIAIASLGLYKYKINIGNFLKISEYLAKGLPIITGSDIGIFKDNPFEYEIKFENNKSPIDFHRVSNFIEWIYHNNSQHQLSIKIRDFAVEYSDVAKTFQPIINTILEHKW